MADNLDYSLSCCVCRDRYSVDGNCKPRTLPCDHTACGFCIKNIIKNNTPGHVVCPICRETHEAEDEEKSFPLNTDILVEVQRQKVCEKHGKKLDYYCFEGKRRIPVCTKCLETDHKGHDFKEVKQFKEQEKKEILEYLDNCLKNVMAREERISGAKNFYYKEFMRGIRNTSWANEMFRKYRAPVDKELSALRSTKGLLYDIQRTVHNGTYDEKNLETFVVSKEVCCRKEFEFPVFNEWDDSGSVSVERYPIILPDWEERMSSQLLPTLTGIHILYTLSILFITYKNFRNFTKKQTK